jgi:hypothetical protein
MAKDSDIAGIEINNIKINSIETTVDSMRDESILISGMTAAGKVIKNCSLPIKVDKLNGDISVNKKSLLPENISKYNDSNNMEDSNIHSIFDIYLEQLKLDYYLQLVILYLLLLVLIFLIMKAISEKDIKLDYIKKLPLANYIKPLLIKVFNI